MKMKADYYIGGGWGNHISWFDRKEFQGNWGAKEITVYGHVPNRPKVRQTLVGEFEKSFVKFEFVSVDYKTDPPDMFFAKVRAIEQELK